MINLEEILYDINQEVPDWLAADFLDGHGVEKVRNAFGPYRLYLTTDSSRDFRTYDAWEYKEQFQTKEEALIIGKELCNWWKEKFKSDWLKMYPGVMPSVWRTTYKVVEYYGPITYRTLLKRLEELNKGTGMASDDWTLELLKETYPEFYGQFVEEIEVAEKKIRLKEQNL